MVPAPKEENGPACAEEQATALYPAPEAAALEREIVFALTVPVEGVKVQYSVVLKALKPETLPPAPELLGVIVTVLAAEAFGVFKVTP